MKKHPCRFSFSSSMTKSHKFVIFTGCGLLCFLARPQYFSGIMGATLQWSFLMLSKVFCTCQTCYLYCIFWKPWCWFMSRMEWVWMICYPNSSKIIKKVTRTREKTQGKKYVMLFFALKFIEGIHPQSFPKQNQQLFHDDYQVARLRNYQMSTGL